MWQFSIKVIKENKIISDLIFNTLKKKTNKLKSVVVATSDDTFCNVSIAIDDKHIECVQEILAKMIAKIVCNFLF